MLPYFFLSLLYCFFNWRLNLLSFFTPFSQFIFFFNWRCLSISLLVDIDGTYGRFDKGGVHAGHGSCRPKGAALIQTRRTYRLPFLISGTTSSVSSHTRAPARLPRRLS